MGAALFFVGTLMGTAIAQTQPAEVGDLVITEFMAEPYAVADYYGEWLEIYNTTTEDLLINGLDVKDSSGTETFEVMDTQDIVVLSGDYFILGVSDETDSTESGYNGGIEVDYVYDYEDLEINKNSDTLTLVYDGITLDSVTWNSADWQVQTQVSHQANLNASYLEWANDLAHNWCASDNYITGVGLKGTPGTENEWCEDSNIDSDGDGYKPTEGDCNDQDAYVNPEAIDGSDGTTYGDANDDANCDGVRDDGDIDDDLDGYTEVEGDCDDTDVEVYPGAAEVENGVDDDCNCYIDDLDADSDGYSAYSGTDYEETAACVSPQEQGLDSDCDDDNADAYPGATEVPYDAVDQDCDGYDECDVDGDGYDADPSDVCPDGDCCEGGDDCDDNDTSVHPNASEGDEPDGLDNDCDGEVDDPFQDQDGDGWAASEGDCWDSPDNPDAAQVYPGADERCDDLYDNDCNGLFNDGCTNTSAYSTIQGGGCGAVRSGAAGLGFAAFLSALLLGLRQRRRGQASSPAER